MGAVRFTSEFKTSLGLEYKVEIYDQDHTGSSTAFKLGAEGFTINWRGNNNDMFEPIVGSECGFTMMVENNTHEQFIIDIASSRENRFWIGVYKGANLWWCGIMASDIARVEDLAFPYAFEVRAYDGLGLLKNSNYANNKYEPIRGYERFTTIIERCLNYLPHIAHYYSESTNFLNTSINWYEDSHTYAQTYDPLYHTYANNDVTYSAADQASWSNAIYTYLSAYEVLANVMKVFGARIMHLEGRFIIEQLETRVTNSFFSRRYGYPVGTASATILVDRASVKPSQSPARRKKAGTYFTWFPALKEVRVAYPSLNRRNFWPPQNFSYPGSGPRALETDTGFAIAAGPGARFQFTCNIAFNVPQYGWGSVISEGDNYYVVAKLLIKIVGTNTYYLVRTINNSQFGAPYGPTVWQQFPGTYDVALPPFLALDVSTFEPISILSTLNILAPPVPFDGTLVVNLSIEKVYGPDATNNLQFNNFDVANIFNFNYQIFNPVLTLQETTSNVTTTIAENDDADNSAKYETEIIWADGDKPNTLGRLRTFDGSVYTDTDKWGVKTVSGTQTIQQLLAERILRMQKTPIRKMYTTVYGADFPLYRNLLDSSDDEWCVLGVTYNANVDEWQGEWFNIKLNSIGTIIFETEEAEQYPGTDNPPGPYGDTSTESFPGTGVAPATLEPLAAAVVAVSYPSGSAPGSGVSVNSVLGAGAFVQGQQIAIVNPSSGQFAYFEVTSDTTAGDTAIAISGSFPSRFPAGSYIINLPSNYTASGGVGPSQGGGGSSGTVTSVGLTMPAIFNVTGSPVTASGDIGVTLNTQTQRLFFASPSGSTGVPTFRGIVAQDVPTLNQNTTGTAANVTGTVAIANGGTGATTASGARSNLGATTVGSSFFTVANPGAIRFPRVNAENTVTLRTAADFRGDIGAGTGNGTVTSVGFTAPNIFSVSGSPVTASGSIGLSLASQSANTFFSGPVSGSNAAPTFRAIVPSDVPTLNQNTTGTAANVTGTVAIANGGTGSTTASGARSNLGATTIGSNIFTATNPSAVTFPRANADNTVSFLNAADFRNAIGASGVEWLYNEDSEAIYYEGSAFLTQPSASNLYFILDSNQNADAFYSAISLSGADQYIAFQPKSVNNKSWFVGRDGSDNSKFKIGVGGNVFASGAIEIDTNTITYVKQIAGFGSLPTITALSSLGTQGFITASGNSHAFVIDLTPSGNDISGGNVAQITLNQAYPTLVLPTISPVGTFAHDANRLMGVHDLQAGAFKLRTYGSTLLFSGDTYRYVIHINGF